MVLDAICEQAEYARSHSVHDPKKFLRGFCQRLHEARVTHDKIPDAAPGVEAEERYHEGDAILDAEAPSTPDSPETTSPDVVVDGITVRRRYKTRQMRHMCRFRQRLPEVSNRGSVATAPRRTRAWSSLTCSRRRRNALSRLLSSGRVVTM